MWVDGKCVDVRRAGAEEIIDLRHAELRQGLPRAEAIFPGDELATTRHYAALYGETVVGCVTLLASEWEGEPAFQLRGMATEPRFRGRGVGRALLEFMEAELSGGGDEPANTLLWCNARTPAVGFYETMGWRVVSEQFDVPTAGPHVKMIKRLQPRQQ